MFSHYFAGYQRVYPQHRHSNQSNSNLSHLKHTSERRVWVPFCVDISCVHLFILSCFRYIYIFAHLFQTENGRLHIIYGLSLCLSDTVPFVRPPASSPSAKVNELFYTCMCPVHLSLAFHDTIPPPHTENPKVYSLTLSSIWWLPELLIHADIPRTCRHHCCTAAGNDGPCASHPHSNTTHSHWRCDFSCRECVCLCANCLIGDRSSSFSLICNFSFSRVGLRVHVVH